MDSKLTLSVDKLLTEKAKLYAKSKGRSLSDLVENYFKVITTNDPISDLHVSDKVKSLRGSFKVSDDFDYKKELSDQLAKKYLK